MLSSRPYFFTLPTRRTQPDLARGGGRLASCCYGSLSVGSTDRCKLRLTLHETSRISSGICIYNFITPTHFPSTTWLLPLIFIGASCAKNLWLTAQSRVNMQQINEAFLIFWRLRPLCNGYHRRKWTRRHKFESWTRLIAFHIVLIPLGKVWIQLISLQLWVNSRAEFFL